MSKPKGLCYSYSKGNALTCNQGCGTVKLKKNCHVQVLKFLLFMSNQVTVFLLGLSPIVY